MPLRSDRQALELSLHFHILIPDAVFVPNLVAPQDPDARPRIAQLEPPSQDDIASLLDRIIAQVTRVLIKSGRLEDPSDDEPEPQLLLALQRSSLRAPCAEPEPPPLLCARKLGYSLHAATSIHKQDRTGLERLARYGLRPPLAQGRLSRAPDGTVLYQMKRRFSDGRHLLRFEPQNFLLRLTALVPPPRFHMVRYAGLFAPHARGRFAFTGRGLRNTPAGKTPAAPASPAAAPPASDANTSAAVASLAPTPAPAPAATQTSRAVPASPSATASPPWTTGTKPATSADPPDSAARHAGDPDDPARARRLDWATLLKRSFGLDCLACGTCGHRMTLIATIEDPQIARKILTHLGLPIGAPP